MSQAKLCCCDSPCSHSPQINPLNLSHFWPLPLIPALLLPLPLSYNSSQTPPLSLPALPPSLGLSQGFGSWAWSCCVLTQTSGVGSHHNQPWSTCNSLWMPPGPWQLSLTPICNPHLPEHSHTLALKMRSPNPRPDGAFSLKPTELFWVCLYGMARCIQTETNFTSTNLSSHNSIFIQTEAFQAAARKPFQCLISCMAWNSRDQQQLPGTVGKGGWGLSSSPSLSPSWEIASSTNGLWRKPNVSPVSAFCSSCDSFQTAWIWSTLFFIPPFQTPWRFPGVNLPSFPTDGWEIALLSTL